MSFTIVPNEIKLQILTNLDFENLCNVQSLSREWNMLSSDDQLWRVLFIAKYPEEPLPTKGQAQKKIREIIITSAAPINRYDLDKITTSFFCSLKWNEKRKLICFFPNQPSYSLKLAQSFGPQRGTKEGFEGPADETEYYQFTDWIGRADVNPAFETIASGKFVHCPEESFHFATSFQQAAIPLASSGSVSTARHPREGWPRLYIPSKCTNAQIEGVDVGFGNTLGYFSAINDWKSPFKLFCISDPAQNKSAWVGLIPTGEAFKFVSIDSEGIVTWEKKDGNRFLSPHPRYDAKGHQALMSNLREHPIKFS